MTSRGEGVDGGVGRLNPIHPNRSIPPPVCDPHRSLATGRPATGFLSLLKPSFALWVPFSVTPSLGQRSVLPCDTIPHTDLEGYILLEREDRDDHSGPDRGGTRIRPPVHSPRSPGEVRSVGGERSLLLVPPEESTPREVGTLDPDEGPPPGPGRRIDTKRGSMEEETCSRNECY